MERGTTLEMVRPMMRAGPAESEEWGLLVGARGGDRGAFERLYRAHVGRIHALLLRMSGSRAEADEMTQEVFVRAWQHLDRFGTIDHFRAWLTRVGVNLVMNERRTLARRGAPLDFDEALHAAPDPAPRSTGMRADLERAVAELPPGARLVFLLYDVHGYSHEEISRMTGQAVGTTKAQLHRARKRLREILES